MSNKKIQIRPSQRGSFTRWATQNGISTKDATKTVLSHKAYLDEIGASTLMGYEIGGWFRKNKNQTNLLERRLGGFYPGKTEMNNTPRGMLAYGGKVPKYFFGGQVSSLGQDPNFLKFVQQQQGAGQMDINRFGRTYGQDMAMGAMKGIGSGNAGDAAYNTTMGIVGAAGPVGAAVSTVSGIGDSIGNPIRQKNEATGLDGGLKHMGAAERSANMGAVFNPFKAATMTMGDKNASSKEKWAAGINAFIPGMGSVLGLGKARAQRLDSQGKAAFNKRLVSGANNELNMMYSNMEFGGPMQGNSSKVVDYNGATHEQGGIKIDSSGQPSAKTGRPAIAEVEDGELSWNDYVFSNTIVYGKRR